MKKHNNIIFDLDSTLVKIEGLDWLAQKKNKLALVGQLTRDSMDGNLPLQEALTRKMKIIAPSYTDMRELGRAYCNSLVEGCAETIGALQKMGKNVYIITGNFQPAVGIVAEKLGIPQSHVFSNTLIFDKKGNYKGFNSKHPLAHNGGKVEIIQKYFRNKYGIVFVGDGATDLETKRVVDLFIGFGGVVEREIVKKNADIFIASKSISPLLSILSETVSYKTGMIK